MEMARDGKTAPDHERGREILKKSDVMDGVAELIGMIQVEAPTFRTAASSSPSTSRSADRIHDSTGDRTCFPVNTSSTAPTSS